MSTVISVENVSKSYRLGAIGGATLKEDFSRWWAKWRGQSNPLIRVGEAQREDSAGGEFWALRNVNFQVQEGEVLGIIGRNGAGKSTLLKILSQVTSPTSGEIKIRGRIASLLEVGTGFHPELTGRENILLNGAILGMTKAEIRRKFDEIVAFSGIEEFIDTPVKRYSSGMYVRLAFAVAAHLEPEILIVDEVLAVGDAEFQKKCLGKMQDVSRGGRTVLLVSHSVPAIISLCTTTLLFEKGILTRSGLPKEVMADYLGMEPEACYRRRQDIRDEIEEDVITAAWLSLPNSPGVPVSTVPNGAQVDLIVQVALKARSSSYVIASFWDDMKRPLWEVVGGEYSLPANGRSELRIRIPLPKLATPSLSVDLALGSNHAFESHIRAAIICMVESEDKYAGGGQRFPFAVDASYEVSSLATSIS